MNDKEKIEEVLRILDEVIAITRYHDNPDEPKIDQKLEEIKKILEADENDGWDGMIKFGERTDSKGNKY